MFYSLRGYQRSWLARDVVAGVTVWAVLVPEALAYATIAGVSPVVGLYAAPAALVLYALLGTSKQLVTGPMSATAALSATAVGAVAAGADDVVVLTAALALVTGAVALAAGLAQLGFVSNFISEPVLEGFIICIALTIIIGQVPKLLGLEGADGNFFEKAWDIVVHLGDTSLATLAVGGASLLVVLGLRRWLPMVPGSLAAVVLGVLAAVVFDLDDHGVAIVGNIDAGLPSIGLPDVSAADYGRLAGAAVGVALVGFAEGLGAAKTYAARQHELIDANRELMGQGAANLGAGLSSGRVVNGSLSKSAVNGAAGARTQASGLVVAVLTIVTLLLLTGLFEDLPEATLAAVVIAAVVELVDIGALVAFRRASSRRLGTIYGVPRAAAARMSQTCSSTDRTPVGRVLAGLPSMTRIMVMSDVVLPLAEIKKRLSEIVDGVEVRHDRVVLTRHGRPAAVIISPDDLESLEETLELLSNPRTMRDIRKAEAAVESGEVMTADELRSKYLKR